MKVISQYFILFIIVLSLSGLFSCTTVTPTPKVVPVQKKENSLDVRARLEPLIVQKIIPKLKQASFIGRPTFIKAGRIEGTGGSVGKIDEVSKFVRKLIWLELSGANGINLVQRHSLAKIKNIRQSHNIKHECKTYSKPEYYLIIDTQKSGDNIYVDIVAQNVEDSGNTTLPGFKAGFRLKADNALINMLENQKLDEYLQGTKDYPIETNDKDSIAEFLAYNVVCTLHDIYYKRRNSGFYIDLDSTKLREYEKQICKQLKPYLIQYYLPIVDSKEQASHIIKPNTGESNGVCNLWVEIKDKATGINLEGGVTRVYYKKSSY